MIQPCAYLGRVEAYCRTHAAELLNLDKAQINYLIQKGQLEALDHLGFARTRHCRLRWRTNCLILARQLLQHTIER